MLVNFRSKIDASNVCRRFANSIYRYTQTCFPCCHARVPRGGPSPSTNRLPQPCQHQSSSLEEETILQVTCCSKLNIGVNSPQRKVNVYHTLGSGCELYLFCLPSFLLSSMYPQVSLSVLVFSLHFFTLELKILRPPIFL